MEQMNNAALPSMTGATFYRDTFYRDRIRINLKDNLLSSETVQQPTTRATNRPSTNAGERLEQ